MFSRKATEAKETIDSSADIFTLVRDKNYKLFALPPPDSTFSIYFIRNETISKRRIANTEVLKIHNHNSINYILALPLSPKTTFPLPPFPIPADPNDAKSMLDSFGMSLVLRSTEKRMGTTPIADYSPDIGRGEPAPTLGRFGQKVPFTMNIGVRARSCLVTKSYEYGWTFSVFVDSDEHGIPVLKLREHGHGPHSHDGAIYLYRDIVSNLKLSAEDDD
ncbi:hypothetical protein HK100_000138 [Physocladia obscura]|uniref:Uncharacterized protein n=1 Tax=Physocladia obscura TaxID=109957 RepID=A0AAD5TAP1_9FUNG|nr:hypothetical protein HK100_000138 [Physocladia obscura]